VKQEKLPSYKQYPTYSSEKICTQFDISEEARALAGNAKTICSLIEFCLSNNRVHEEPVISEREWFAV
jgi:hypothetical protein